MTSHSSSTSYRTYSNYGQHVSGPGNITNNYGPVDPVRRFLLENIAAKAMHDANNTDFEFPKCYSGTREDIKGDLTEWVENTERRYPIYWLYAPAGSGKTAIAKTFADSCSISSTRNLLASFFFRRTSVHQNTEERFIPTIAFQLMTNLPQTSHFIADAINENPAIFQKDPRVQMDQLILDPLRKACETATEAVRATWPRLLVIDGLDECLGQGAQLKLLDIVSQLVRQESFPLVVFLSCRPEAHIRDAFQGEHLSRMSLKICLPETYNSHDDIRKFLTGEFQEVVKAHSHIPESWPGENIIRLLVEKSSSQFIYASTVIKYIAVRDDDPMERLDIVRGLEKSPDDENPFAELDALYKHILACVKRKYLPIVVRVLQVTIVQSEEDNHRYPRPSLHCKLAPFLGLKSEEVGYSLRNLEGILVEQLTDRPSVKFHHASFGDFLLDGSRSGHHFIDISLAYTQYIIRLFRYVLNDDNSIGEDNTNSPSLRRYLGLTPTSFAVPNLVIAIRFFLDRLSIVAPTNELYQMLGCATKGTEAQKIIHTCTSTDKDPVLEWYQDLFSWELVAKFTSTLGKLAFNDSLILKHNFLDEVRKYVSRELRKYAKEPLRHLITLFMVDRSIPPFHHKPWHPRFPSVLSIFGINNHVLPSDRTSLNLAPLLWTHSGVNDCDSHRWGFLRQLIRETERYSIKPEAYSATCVCIMKWTSDLSVEKAPFIIPWQPEYVVQKLGNLALDVFSSLQYMGQVLWGNTYPDICPEAEAVILWPVFGGPLLGKAGLSVGLQKCLIETEWMIYLILQMDTDERRRRKMWKPLKKAIDEYLLRDQSCASASLHVLGETGSISMVSSSSASESSVGMSVPNSAQSPSGLSLSEPCITPRISSPFAGKSFEPFVSTVGLNSGHDQQDWSIITFNNKVGKELDVQMAHSLCHERAVHCVNFSGDGQYLAAGCGDGKAYIYCVQTGTLTRVLKNLIAKYEYITTVCFIHNERLATGSADGKVYIWEIKKKYVRNAFKGHTHWILSVNASPNGRLLVAASRDNTVRLWNMRSGAAKVLTDNSMFSYEPFYSSAVFSPDGRYIAASHKDSVVRIWDVRTGQLKRRLRAHTDWVYNVGFMPNGKGLVSGSRDTTLKYWDVSYLDSRFPATSSQMSNDSHRLEAMGIEEQPQPEREFLGHKNSVHSVAISPDSRWVASGSAGDGVIIWNTRSAVRQCVLNHNRWISTVDFSPAGGYLASGGYDGTVRLWRYSAMIPD